MELRVSSSFGDYFVRISSGLRAEISAHSFGVVDERFVSTLLGANTAIVPLVVSEEAKTLNALERLLLNLDDLGMTKSDVPAAIGGGVIQDVATLAFSLYMRGVKWHYFPTTLMAMMDSCVGGKSSINLGSRKNRIGNFFPPQRVVIDPWFILSQDNVGIVSGLSEGSKIAYAAGPDILEEFVASPAAIRPSEDEQTSSLIGLSLKSKIQIIEEDEFDVGRRKLLNFGHSFGHALEAATGFQTPHGVAVALGMLSAIHHAGGKKSQTVESLREYLNLLLQKVQPALKAIEERIDWGVFSATLAMDKKNSRDQLVLVIPAPTGLLELQHFDKNSREISRCIESVKSAFLEVGSQ